MKVLYVIPDGIDLGGIITSSENLMQGFREAGHTATFALLRNVENPRPSKPGGADAGNFVIGAGTGMWMHPTAGWRGEYFSTINELSRAQFSSLVMQHDVVVWGALYGLRDKTKTEGRNDWLSLFSCFNKPTVVMIRDDHLEERYPWAIALERYITGWAGVQQASYDSLKGLRRPRALIYSGHDLTNVSKGDNLTKRKGKLISVQTFKRWKKVDALVAAVPHMPNLDVSLAGTGIELHYMRSVDKCRDAYYCRDVEAPGSCKGKPIWENALRYGMNYLGVLKEEERDAKFRESQFLVDLSSRMNSGQTNRVIIEAMKMGCVPIAFPNFISGRVAGDGELFKAGIHYLPINPFVKPKELADKLKEYIEIKPAKYKAMQEANYELIQKFDRKLAAQQLVDLAKGKKAGHKYERPTEKTANNSLIMHGERQFAEIFGAIK